MDALDLVPDVHLNESALICRQFRERGIVRFQAACRWVRDLPYGANEVGRYPEAVFAEMRGTCQSKHSLIAALAREIGVPVDKYVGAYRLDGSIYEGADAVLAASGLSYVPQTHCVLKHDERFFDLTAGNCHGKKRDVTGMDAYFRVRPFATDAEERRIYELAVQYYQQTDERLAQRSVDEIRHIAGRCRVALPLACAAP